MTAFHISALRVHAAVHINIIYRYLEIRMKSAVIVLFSHSMSLCAPINNSCFEYFIAACILTLSPRAHQVFYIKNVVIQLHAAATCRDDKSRSNKYYKAIYSCSMQASERES